jgi:hypothetical protein
MDHVLYWLDLGGWLAPLQHAWIWACVTMVLAIVSIAGIAAVARRYDQTSGDPAQFSAEA